MKISLTIYLRRGEIIRLLVCSNSIEIAWNKLADFEFSIINVPRQEFGTVKVSVCYVNLTRR